MSQYCDHLNVAFCERDSFEVAFDDAPDYVGFAQAVTSTRILGYFVSAEALTEAIPNPNIGDTYGIGEEAPYNLYVYSTNGWIDNGVPSGPPGPPGPQGNDGPPGPPGPAAAVTSWEVKYQASASGTTIPTGTWSASIPEVPDGQHLWTRTEVTYSDGTTTTSYSVVRGAGGGAVTRDAIIDALGYTPANDATAMVYKILTFDGSAFKDADGNTLTYAQIKAFCLNTKNFVYAQYSNRLYIPQYISGNNIFFESSYIDTDIPYMHRLGINNANQTSNQTIRLTKSTETTALADRVTTAEADLDGKVNYSDALTLEEIAASTDLSGKIASAQAAKTLNDALRSHISHTYLALRSVYGSGSDPINIDQINNGVGYIYRCGTTAGAFSGTSPTGILGCNAFLLIGFSVVLNSGLIQYGVQIAIGFGSNKIAIRNAQYNASGGSWGAWRGI